MNWLKKWWKKTELNRVDIIERARQTLVFSADRIAQLLKDENQNGFPDLAEQLASHAMRLVSAVELIEGHNGNGAAKLNALRIEIMAAAGKAQWVWGIVHPYIEAAVNLLPRKRIA